MLETRQFRVRWRIQPDVIEEKEYHDILHKYVEDNPYELHWIQLYIKKETNPGDLCLFLLQKNAEGSHIHPDEGKLDSKPGVIYYKEVQKKGETHFEGYNFDFVYPKPIHFNANDKLNLNLKASNRFQGRLPWSKKHKPMVNFIFTLGYKVLSREVA